MSRGEKWLVFWAFIMLFFLIGGLSIVMLRVKIPMTASFSRIFQSDENMYRKIRSGFDLKEYQKTLDMSSDFLALYPESDYRVKVMLLTAEIFYFQKDLNKAEEIIRKIFAESSSEGPDFIQAVELLGAIARETGVYDPIVNNYLESAYLKADAYEKSRICVYLGYQALYKKDFTESLRFFSEAAPDDGIIGRARVYIEKGNYPQAIQEYLNFFQTYPADERYGRVKTAFIKQSVYYAETLAACRDYSKAIQYYNNVVLLFPDDPETYGALLKISEIYSVNKDFKSAVIFADRAIKKNEIPGNEEALYRKAVIYYQWDKKREAIGLFKELQDKYPAGTFGKKAGEWIDLITKDIESN